MNITESQFQAQVVQLAKLHRWKVYHTFDSRNSVAGFPDLVLLRGSRLVVAELKREKGGKVSEEQNNWLAAFQMTNAEAYLWRPSDWPMIEEVLGRKQ